MAIDLRLPHLLLLLLLLPLTLHAEERQLLDRIVAVVNDDIVLQSEFDSELKQVQAKLAQLGVNEIPEDEVRKQALERLILRKLQLQEAARLGLDADEQTLQQALVNIAQRNGMTVPQLEKAMEAQGISPAGFRKQLREEIILQRLHNREVISRIQVTKAEVDNYLANNSSTDKKQLTYHLRHILIPTPEGASSKEIEKARAKAHKLIQRLRAGADFATLATRYSKDQQALQGGDMGWLPAGQVPTLFAQELNQMNPGDIRGPLQSPSGFHIIKLEDVKGIARKVVKQTHVRHILIRTDEHTSSEEAKIRADQLYQRIKGGEDFAALARANSDDKTSAIRGGDLGWVSPGDLVPTFEQAMNHLKPGQLSKPVRTPFGWHVIQVLERRNKDVTAKAKRDAAKLAIRKRKSEEALQLYLRKLRGQAYVETRLDQLD